MKFNRIIRGFKKLFGKDKGNGKDKPVSQPRPRRRVVGARPRPRR